MISRLAWRLAIVEKAKENATRPPLEMDNHHNALACPYCNPEGQLEAAVVEHAVAHWFTQGGHEFGDIGQPTNVDELISAILAAVRRSRQ
jgi:hypothetical protein